MRDHFQWSIQYLRLNHSPTNWCTPVVVFAVIKPQMKRTGLINTIRDDNVTSMRVGRISLGVDRPALRSRDRRLRWFLVALLAACLSPLLACAGESINDRDLAMPLNRIAYIDSDGQLITVLPDGAERRLLTVGSVAGAGGRLAGLSAQPLNRERVYSWPVWSPDGSRIAVSLVTGTSSDDAEISVQSLEAESGVGGSVFVNPAPMSIADGTPHYVQWSPDGRRLGITAATPEGLTLFVADADPTDGVQLPAAPVAVQRGAPLYFDWSPDSRSLAVHSGEQVTVLHIDDVTRQIGVQPIGESRSFRTPAWSPDGAQLAWSGPGGDGEALWLGRPADPDSNPLRLAEVDGSCAFLWSSDGHVLAVVDRQIEGSPAYRRLRLIASDGSGQRTIREDDWVLGFFWEPHGQRLAWVALNAEERTMEWRITPGEVGAGEVGAGEGDTDQGPAGGLRFSPSGATFLMLAFFDQYAVSHSPWAPDGSALVIAGDQQYLSNRRNGSSGEGSRVYVTETGADGGLLDIGNGSLAVWSTR